MDRLWKIYEGMDYYEKRIVHGLVGVLAFACVLAFFGFALWVTK